MDSEKIKNNELYKNIIQDENIYIAIYSIESYIFEPELLSDGDYKDMIKLRDPFNHDHIKEVIEKVKEKIEKIIIDDDYFTASVYFRPKKIEGEKIVSRPLHTADLITLITSVVFINALILEMNMFENNKKKDLSEIGRMLPSNFYGNIPSKRIGFLFEPWRNQFRKYTDKITEEYDKYSRTKEYEYEVSLDLKNFFPSINPNIIYCKILKSLHTKALEKHMPILQMIVEKLLLWKIDNIRSTELEKEYYKGASIKLNDDSLLSQGIPQGLPHAYFFGNICMIEVSKIFEEELSGEAYYYVDDSVIYTNQLDSDFKKKIEIINEKLMKLEKLETDYEVAGKKLFKKVKMNDNIKYGIEVHDLDSEKSLMLKVGDQKFGQSSLNRYSRLASMASNDLKSMLSDDEERNIYNKMKVLYNAIENEIDRVSGEKIETNYLKIIKRFRKFFLYRERCLNYRMYEAGEKEKKHAEELLESLKLTDKEDDEKKLDLKKLSELFKKYEKNDLINEIKILSKYMPEFGEQFEKSLRAFDKLIYGKYNETNGNKDITYFSKVFERVLAIREEYIGDEYFKYKSAEKIVQKGTLNLRAETSINSEERIKCFVKYIKSWKNGSKESDGIDRFRDIFEKLGLDGKEVNNNIYHKVNYSTEELYRLAINAVCSAIIGVEINDTSCIYKKNRKAITYNEFRLLMFVRNRNFSIDDFVELFSDFDCDEVVDYSIMEVVDYFRIFTKEPKYVDNLIKIHKYTSDIWKNGSKFLHFYTLHNQEHAAELIKNIVKFIKSVDYFQIKAIDYYVLFLSCYLHDISMVLYPDLYGSFIRDDKEANLIFSKYRKDLKEIANLERNIDKNNFINSFEEEDIKRILVNYYIELDKYYENYIRKMHAKKSAEFIKETKDLSFIDHLVMDIVANVSESHGWSSDEIYKRKSQAKRDTVSIKYLKILLRIADLMDMSSSRVNNSILNNNKDNMDDVTKFHWLTHKVVDKIEVKVDYKPKQLDEEFSFLSPRAIAENINLDIWLNTKHDISIEKNKNCGLKIRENNEEFSVLFGNSCETDCKENNYCKFNCKWMKEKNSYLYKELEELQNYLKRSNLNIFETHILVNYKFKKDVKKLNNSEYQDISALISK